MIIKVPLKTGAQSFSLFKIVVFPMRLSHDSFLKYQIEYSYFGLAVDQRDFTLLTEADLQRCTTSTVTICPAEVRYKTHSYQYVKIVCSCRMKIVTDCAARTFCAHTDLRLSCITGRSGLITFPIHVRSTFGVPRTMAGAPARCLSSEVDSFTTRPPFSRKVGTGLCQGATSYSTAVV